MLEGEAAERWVDEWQAGIEKHAAQARALSGRLAQLTATARSDDGLVEVTVGSSGAMTGLRLEEGIRDQSAATTSGQILAVIRAAQAKLTRQVSEVTAETVGLETETGRAIVGSFANRFAGAAEGEADDDR